MVKSMKKGLAIALAAVMVFSISPFVGKSETVKAETVELGSLECTGWWTAHSQGIKLEDGKTVTINFTNTSEYATENWLAASYILYYASEQFAGGSGIRSTEGYEEIFFGRADNYGWAEANADEKNTASLPTGFYYQSNNPDWDAFKTNNVAGSEGTITATLDGSTVKIVMSLSGAVNVFGCTTVDTTKDIYLSINGQDTTLENIRYSKQQDMSLLNCTRIDNFFSSHTRGIELVDGKQVSIDFKSTSDVTAVGFWDSVIYDLYYASGKFAGGSGITETAGYQELFVGRADDFGWKTWGTETTNGGLPSNYSYTKIKDVPATAFVDGLIGAEGTITALLDGSTVTVTMSLAGAENKIEITGIDTSEKGLYIALTGEKCRLSDLSYSCYYSDISGYRGETKVAPDSISGTKFAGWFSDAECTTPIGGDAAGAYAKFVDSNLLNLRYQLRAETDTNSESTSVRIMLGVDRLNYKNVGFDVTFKGTNYELKSTKVCSSIDITDANVTKLDAPNKYFGSRAEYMLPYALTNIAKADFGEAITVVPYWTTLDGTKISGDKRTIKVDDCL